MKRRIPWGWVCLASAVWTLLCPAMVVHGERFVGHYFPELLPILCGPIGFNSNGPIIGGMGQGFILDEPLWLIVSLMVPGQILLVVSFAKFFSNNHVSQARGIRSRRDA